MVGVKWIKVYTNMVNNKKIKRIRKMPEGNNIILIWVFLLAQAGECNRNGALYLTDTIPFRIEDLAIEFDFEVQTIQLALITLEKFSMIEIFDNIIYIKNWNEYQNIEGLDKIREQTRVRVERYREKQKSLPSNAMCNVTVTQGNETDIELDKELDKDKDKQNTLCIFFESVWNLYPNKKGKAQISDTKKKELQKVGFEVLQKCIDRYVRTKEEWKEYQNGSTFFNKGYVDYLDENFEEPPKVQQKPSQKKSIKDNFEQREYPDEVLESLYANKD